MRYKNFCLVLAAAPAFGFSQSFNLIGDLPGGAVHSHVYAISNNGIAAGFSMGVPNAQAVRWSAGSPSLQQYGVFGGNWTSSHAQAISADGLTAVGTSEGGAGTKAMVWKNGGFVALSDSPGGANNARADGISADGKTVVGYSEGFSGAAVRWTLNDQGGEVSRQILPDLVGGANYCQALDVSGDGSSIVGFGTVNGGIQNAALWKNGVVQSLGTLPNGGFLNSTAYAISADGNTVVGQAMDPQGTHAFRWTEATGMVSLGDFPGGYFASHANAVSGDGKKILGYGTLANNKTTPFFWSEETGMVQLEDYLKSKGLDLSPLGTGHLFIASNISDDGRYIVGQTEFLDGTRQGFVADLGPAAAPVPEPASMAALGLGAIGLLRRRNKRK